MDSLDKLKRKHAVLRTATTKVLTKIEVILTDTSEMTYEQKFDQLSVLKEQLIEKYDCLKQLNCEIESGLTLEDTESEIEVVEDYNEKIIEWKNRITRYLDKNLKANPQIISHDSRVLSSENSVPSNNTGPKFMKLPKLTIEKYYGDSCLWLEFWSQFSNATDSNEHLTPLDKFCYLKSLLGGSAANAVSGFSLTNENYSSAIVLLKERFGRTDVVINAHMNKLLNLNPVKNSSNLRALRELYDNCEIQIRNLNSLGVASGSYGHLLCPILLKLIPPDIALEFNRRRAKSSDWDINELITFIKEEIESREVTMHLNSSVRISHDKPEKYRHQNFKLNIPTASALSTSVKNNCFFCSSSEHNSNFCESLSVPEKRKKLKNDGRCFVCFRKFHIAAKCKLLNEPCKICGSKFHHVSICMKSNEKPPDVPKNESDTIVTSVSQCEIKNSDLFNEVVLQTCCVKISSDLKSKFALCLFDSGSQRTFITKELTSYLKPPVVRKEKLLVYSFGALKAKQKIYDVDKVTLQNVKIPERNICIEALVTDTISTAMIYPPRLNTDVQSKLKKYELSNWNTLCGFRVQLLIGADYLWQINIPGTAEKITKSLFVCESLFGWSLCGSIYNDEKGKNKDASVFKLSVENAEQEDLKKLWDLEAIAERRQMTNTEHWNAVGCNEAAQSN
ncbi:hypothetical protein X975_19634, partial [Stegodyphus mimosarum]